MDSNPGDRLHRHGDNDSLIEKFFDFCRVDLGLSEVTSKEYRRKMRRFLRAVGKPAASATAEDVRGYLKPLSARDRFFGARAFAEGNIIPKSVVLYHESIPLKT